MRPKNVSGYLQGSKPGIVTLFLPPLEVRPSNTIIITTITIIDDQIIMCMLSQLVDDRNWKNPTHFESKSNFQQDFTDDGVHASRGEQSVCPRRTVSLNHH